jgi:hypothetical protein
MVEPQQRSKVEGSGVLGCSGWLGFWVGSDGFPGEDKYKHAGSGYTHCKTFPPILGWLFFSERFNHIKVMNNMGNSFTVSEKFRHIKVMNKVEWVFENW